MKLRSSVFPLASVSFILGIPLAAGGCGGSDTAVVIESAPDGGGGVSPGIDAAIDAASPTTDKDSGPKTEPEASSPSHAVQTVFVIMMENHSWAGLKGNTSAPYINGTLLPMSAHAEQYATTVHPSELNYIWLEAGDTLTIIDDADPTEPKNQQPATNDHLSAQLTKAGIPWKAYAEDIDGTSCPLTSSPLLGPGDYAAKHTPQIFFADVTDNFSFTSANCIAHVRPYSELAADLTTPGKLARYNFISPNLCHDMHNAINCGTASLNIVKAGDDWLAANVPPILASPAFANGGLLLVLWDEGDAALTGQASNGPIPLFVTGSMVKKGYESQTAYSHSSTLKTIEEIFGVPLLRAAGDPKTHDLSDMFQQFP